MRATARKIAYPHIVRNPRIRRGEPVVQGTRIPVAALVRGHQLGMEFDEILVQYPSLRPEQLHAAFAYFFDHREEIESLLAEADTVPSGAAIVES